MIRIVERCSPYDKLEIANYYYQSNDVQHNLKYLMNRVCNSNNIYNGLQGHFCLFFDEIGCIITNSWAVAPKKCNTFFTET